MIGEHADHSVVHLGSQRTVSRAQRLAETTSSWTDLDAADEHVVALDTDQPRLPVRRRAVRTCRDSCGVAVTTNSTRRPTSGRRT